MAVALDSVVKQLTDSGIIAPGRLENFVPPKANPKDGETLLRELHKQNLLTKFQAQQVAAGRTRALLLGNYTLLDKIGAGGMGQVFKAEHRRMKRVVAIKMLPPAVTRDAAAIARFQREVEAAAKLRHTNIVAADDADEANGSHFLVMEYVAGKDLSALVKQQGPLPVATAVNCILQAARGLDYAHRNGIVHRDIKPGNLLLGADGTVKILDMGLARIDAAGPEQAELTASGAVMGTVDYMAPEQARSTHKADARADIYSLGCTLYYLLTGRPVYEADSLASKLLAHQCDPIPALQALRPDVPGVLQAIFARMVAKRVEERFQSMAEVVAALEAAGSGQASGSLRPVRIAPAGDTGSLTFSKGASPQTLQRPRPVAASKAAPPTARPARGGSGKNRKPGGNTLVLAGAGGFGMVAVLLAVMIIVRNQKGEEVARVKVPDGHTVEVQADAEPADVRARPHNPQGEKPANETAAAVPKVVPAPAGSADSPGPAKLWDTPAFRAWMEHTQALSAEQQVDAVVKKLVELNPGFDGNAKPKIAGNVVEDLLLKTDRVTDVSPVRALQSLKGLTCTGKGLSDLSPLAGMSLTSFNCADTNVSDLSPLRGMRLTFLDCTRTPLTNLEPLHGLPLAILYCTGTQVSDLSPLKGMPLTKLGCGSSQVADLSPLASLPLIDLLCNQTRVSELAPLEQCRTLKTLSLRGSKVPAAAVAALRRALPDCRIDADEQPPPVKPSPGLVCEWVATKKGSAGLAAGAQAFDGPEGDGRRKGTGVLIGAPDGWQTAGTAWTFDYRRNGSPYGMQIIHPFGPGHVLVSVWRDLGISTGGDWDEFGWGDPKSPLQLDKAADFVKTLPIETQGDASVRVVSRLDAAGNYRLEIDGRTVLQAKIDKATPLTLDLREGRKAGSAKGAFSGAGLPRPLAPGEAGLIMGPMDGGVHSASNVRLETAQGAAAAAGPALGVSARPLAPAGPAETGGTGGPWDTPEFRAWLRQVQAMPAEEQVKAVAAKLEELNPAFTARVTDASTKKPPKIENGMVTEFCFAADNLGDISPVRALAGLRILKCYGTNHGRRMITDLSPLRGMQLTTLECSRTAVADLTPLAGLPLKVLNFGETRVASLAPLEGMQLDELLFWQTPISDLSPLAGMPLSHLQCGQTRVKDLSPLRGMPLKRLECHDLHITDLTPLVGMPLTSFISFRSPELADIAPLETCKSLQHVNVGGTKVSAASVGALKRALPRCSVEW